MSASRWTRLLMLVTLAGLIAAGATEARAQVFKPRGKSAAVGRAPAPAAARKAAATTTGPAAVSSKTPTRATGPTPRRVGKTQSAAPQGKKARNAARSPDDDVVVIDDDDDDDVKITDDD